MGNKTRIFYGNDSEGYDYAVSSFTIKNTSSDADKSSREDIIEWVKRLYLNSICPVQRMDYYVLANQPDGVLTSYRCEDCDYIKGHLEQPLDLKECQYGVAISFSLEYCKMYIELWLKRSGVEVVIVGDECEPEDTKDIEDLFVKILKSDDHYKFEWKKDIDKAAIDAICNRCRSFYRYGFVTTENQNILTDVDSDRDFYVDIYEYNGDKHYLSLIKEKINKLLSVTALEIPKILVYHTPADWHYDECMDIEKAFSLAEKYVKDDCGCYLCTQVIYQGKVFYLSWQEKYMYQSEQTISVYAFTAEDDESLWDEFTKLITDCLNLTKNNLFDGSEPFLQEAHTAISESVFFDESFGEE